MTMPITCYHDQVVRAVTGKKPAMVFHVADKTTLRRLCDRLAEAERAVEILRAKGYGRPGLLLHEVAALVPTQP